MANHVYQYLSIEGNDAAIDEWGRIVDSIKESYPITDRWFEHYPEHFAKELNMPEYDEDKSYDWYIDNIGAKWAHITDLEESYICVTSAWSVCDVFCNFIAKHLQKFDEDIKIVNYYDDEFYNFTGVMVTERDDIMDYDEMSWDEVCEIRNNGDTEYNTSDDEEFDDWLQEWKDNAYRFLTGKQEDV